MESTADGVKTPIDFLGQADLASRGTGAGNGKAVVGVEGDLIWERLQKYSFDQPGPYPFSKRLAKENGWPYPYALEVIEELRRLLYLLTKDGTLVAAPDVETAWRLHLIYTDCYFKQLCRAVLGKTIDHACDDGSQSSTVMSRRFARTIAAYRATFGEPPPGIWFEPDWFGLRLHRHLLHKATTFVLRPQPRQVIAPVEIIPQQHRAFWNKLKAFQFDKPGALYPFSKRLADESFDGDHEYALAAIDEYRKFLFLLGSTGKWVTPALDIDEAWHLHLDFTRLYWVEMMDGVFGKRLGHHPGNGSSEDDSKFQAIYQRTLHDYQQHFGEPPVRTWGRIDPNLNWKEALSGTGY